MSPALRLRKLISVLVTGVFFAVAALGELSGATPQDAFVRAAIAGLVVAGLAIAFLRTVEDALSRAASEEVGGSKTKLRPEGMTGADESGDR
jgi:hypothetical protein